MQDVAQTIAPGDGPEGPLAESEHVPLENGDHAVELRRLSEEDKTDVLEVLCASAECEDSRDSLPGTLGAAMCFGRTGSIV